MTIKEAEPDTLLKGVSLRVTAPRVAVLKEVKAHPHADVDSIVTGVRQQIGSVSTQAVYDVLRALTEARLVRRMEPAGSPARYEVRLDDNHHHMVCRSCGAIHDVQCATAVAPCLEVVDAAGFAIDEAEVTYWGLCPDCQQSTS